MRQHHAQEPARRARRPRLTAAVPLAVAACVMTACVVTAAAPAAPALAAPVPAAAPAAGPASAVRLELPRPTGPYAVGRDTLHLVDEDRKDPWVPQDGPRQLMVSMYYPARSDAGPSAPYMSVAEAESLLRRKAPGVSIPPETVSATRTHAHTGAAPKHGRFPLVVLSPGLGLPRASLTFLAEELASRGYVVALVDHAYESSGTTFPDGRTLTCAPLCDQPKPPEGGQAAITKSRTLDVSFVIDELTGRRSAWKMAAMIAPGRIGMAGHSLGGDAGAATMAADKRVRAGVNLDGTFHPAVPAGALGGRPFLLMGSHDDHVPGKDDTWDASWSHMDGWKRWLTVAHTDHTAFTDLALLQQAAGMSAPGALSPQRSLQITRAYVGAFFDLHLKRRKQPLLDGPAGADPEVAFHTP
ncbi:alpha/beta hydrolase [Nonomuraea sp. 3-1Str]|uniref:alpha/beta hydrolase family protein n=1 Tax=Nonomuraea sp. 3-1Str TaxID=2929801 RepID=UPI002865FC11|nr:alpha/beta hydrolase [Nonomuraea sp. 3-1Str]MDR8413194.1 alpha/beta hydrolase [Nonomuraea sp. 3-1Str]